jgi:hypothetical protein
MIRSSSPSSGGLGVSTAGLVHQPGHHRGPIPTDHEVADGVMYQFGIHDSRLSDDPGQGRAGGYE